MTEEKITWESSRAISQQLMSEAKPIGECSLADSSIYALVYAGDELGSPWSEPRAQIIYVGRGGEDSVRHFADDTAVSTVRRSLAAMLAAKYQLEPIAGSDDPEDLDRFSNYKLDAESEAKLTEWMNANLCVGILNVPAAEVDPTYFGLLDFNTPIFNFQDNPNNLYGSQVKTYRLQMAERAAEKVQE